MLVAMFFSPFRTLGPVLSAFRWVVVMMAMAMVIMMMIMMTSKPQASGGSASLVLTKPLDKEGVLG